MLGIEMHVGVADTTCLLASHLLVSSRLVMAAAHAVFCACFTGEKEHCGPPVSEPDGAGSDLPWLLHLIDVVSDAYTLHAAHQWQPGLHHYPAVLGCVECQ